MATENLITIGIFLITSLISFIYQYTNFNNKITEMKLNINTLIDKVKKLEDQDVIIKERINYLNTETELTKSEFKFIKENILDIKESLKKISEKIK